VDFNDRTFLNQRGILHTVYPPFLVPERFATIGDGTANTLLIGEHHVPDTQPREGSFWACPVYGYTVSEVHPNGWTLMNNRYDACWAAFPMWKCHRSWGAWHPGGLNFALGDGSVRFISLTVNADMLAGMATIAGGEVAQLP